MLEAGGDLDLGQEPLAAEDGGELRVEQLDREAAKRLRLSLMRPTSPSRALARHPPDALTWGIPQHGLLHDHCLSHHPTRGGHPGIPYPAGRPPAHPRVPSGAAPLSAGKG